MHEYDGMPNGTEETDTGIDQINIDQLEGSFSKDGRYSMELWVAADKENIFHNLNTREIDILDSKACLNDIIKDGSMNLLKYQFPDLDGFQPADLAILLDFEKHLKPFIQIINRTPNGSGSRWRAVSNINCMEDEVGINDSAFQDLPHVEELVVASLIETSSSVWKWNFWMFNNNEMDMNVVYLQSKIPQLWHW